MDWAVRGKRILLLSVWILWFPYWIYCGEVRFVVEDSSSSLPVQHALIIFENDGSERLTNDQGVATFQVLEKYSRISFAFYRVDYDSLHVNLSAPLADTILYVRLHPNPPNMTSVTVEDYRENRLKFGEYIWTSSRWERTPLIINDPIRLLSSHPSTVAVTDYNSQFFVRGGSPDQNLFYLDGIPISNPYRLRIALGGGFSILNQNLVRSVDFYPGNFPVDFGGQALSIVNVTAREGAKEGHHLRLDLNPFEGEVQFEGPLTGSLRINTAYRRGFIKDIFNIFKLENVVRPEFSDFQGSMIYTFNHNHYLKFGWLLGDEDSYIEYSGSSNVGRDGLLITSERNTHRLFYLKHRLFFQDNISLENILAYKVDKNYFSYQFDPANSLESTKTTIVDMKQNYLQFRQTFSLVSNRIQLRSGWGFQAGPSSIKTSDYAFLQYETIRALDEKDTLFTGEAFAEFDWQLSSKLRSNFGLRLDYSSFYTQYPRFSPRGVLKYHLLTNLHIFAGAGIYYQFPFLESMVYRLPVVNLYRPYQNKPLKPEKYPKFELGWLWNMQNRLNIHASIFYSYCDNALLTYENAIYSSVATKNSGKFRSKGVEFWLDWSPSKKEPGFNLFLSGAYHHSRQYYKDTWHPAYGDIRESLLLRISVPFYSRFYATTQVNWLASLGTPQGKGIIQTGYLQGNSLTYESYVYNIEDDVNYFRWDLRLGARVFSQFNLYVDFINLSNHRNLFTRHYISDQSGSGIELSEVSIYNFPFIVFLGIQWKIL